MQVLTILAGPPPSRHTRAPRAAPSAFSRSQPPSLTFPLVPALPLASPRFTSSTPATPGCHTSPQPTPGRKAAAPALRSSDSNTSITKKQAHKVNFVLPEKDDEVNASGDLDFLFTRKPQKPTVLLPQGTPRPQPLETSTQPKSPKHESQDTTSLMDELISPKPPAHKPPHRVWSPPPCHGGALQKQGSM
eukprot:TRINITY_DN3824_c0_g1_i3.p1 TRINITY_DN3824_c0_g1~~TRINITY_DN3824_c0_g1_i3.p1  ORF type:complete len:190 (+),score=43.93 TRINITY_DN3824_c0_g1_i3:126-695(+)